MRQIPPKVTATDESPAQSQSCEAVQMSKAQLIFAIVGVLVVITMILSVLPIGR
jgi:hypothetical protein